MTIYLIKNLYSHFYVMIMIDFFDFNITNPKATTQSIQVDH